MRKNFFQIGKIQIIYWGRFPTFKKGTYPKIKGIKPFFKYWYFGLFEIRKLL